MGIIEAAKLDGANEVQKITIVPRGEAGGYNLMLPKEENYLATKNELLQRVVKSGPCSSI